MSGRDPGDGSRGGISLLNLRLRSLLGSILGDVSDSLFAESLRGLELLDILGVMRVLAVTILL